MSNIQTKSERAKASRAYVKMRSDYRATLAEKPIEFDAADFVDVGKTILHGPRLRENRKITVKIPRWFVTSPPFDPANPDEQGEFVSLQLDSDDGKGFVEVASHRFLVPTGQTDYTESFPYAMDISINDLPEHANCELKYVITYYNTSEDESPTESFLCDRVRPYGEHPPEALTLDDPFVDDANLPVGSKLKLTVPSSSKYEWKDGDNIATYLFDVNNVPDDLTGITPIAYGPLTDPSTTTNVVEIDEAKIRAFGDAKVVFLHIIRDKALNDSLLSLWTNATFTFGLLPALPLDKPEVDQADPVLLLEHVWEGVSVWIKRPTAFKPGDTLTLSWGNTQVVKDFPIPDNGSTRIEVPVVPLKTLLLEYGETTAGAKDTLVSYLYVRKGRPFGPASDTFKVNLESPIGWLPWPPEEEWPVPTHPSLLKGDVVNHDGNRTNQLTRDDKNEDAFFDFKWFAEAENGHVVDFEWNGVIVPEARLEFDDTPSPGPGHTPGGDARVSIPWRYIKEGKNGPKVPVRYWVSKTGLDNELPSEITEVDVNAIALELPQATFPTVPARRSRCGTTTAGRHVC
ncbi:hypothetical protein ACSFE6_16220 [Pseudomonas baetica]|uniref:hypothetical protein n=1 Tax=Pseudomonas baetica TaxID=674054 RepID=UPI003EEAFDC5